MPNDAVFSINFLRQDRVSPVFARLLGFCAFGYLAISILTAVFLAATAARTYKETRLLEQSFASIPAFKDLRGEWPLFQKQITDRIAELDVAIAVQKNHFHVSEKLAVFGKTLPEKVWVSSVKTDRSKKSIAVQALYIGREDEPYKVPSKEWMAALKADPVFGRHLKRLEMVESPQRVERKAELYSFGLLAEWDL